MFFAYLNYLVFTGLHQNEFLQVFIYPKAFQTVRRCHYNYCKSGVEGHCVVELKQIVIFQQLYNAEGFEKFGSTIVSFVSKFYCVA